MLRVYERFRDAVAYIRIRTPIGDESIGSAFHVGDGVFVTARHVLQGNTLLGVGGQALRQALRRYEATGPEAEPFEIAPDQVDVARRIADGPDVTAFRVPHHLTPSAFIPLGSHLDDWINDDAFMLADVLLMGYPPIPTSREPRLVAARAEVNAVVDRYNAQHVHFVLSAMARGGFSGAPVVWQDFLLGMVTESLLDRQGAAELGYMAVLTVEPIYVLLNENDMLPPCQEEGWDGTWEQQRRQRTCGQCSGTGLVAPRPHPNGIEYDSCPGCDPVRSKIIVSVISDPLNE